MDSEWIWNGNGLEYNEISVHVRDGMVWGFRIISRACQSQILCIENKINSFFVFCIPKC